MGEENKKREWVKNVTIIFLAVMLVLTFFSNTIMNWSLPEVSAQYVSGGQLSEQIRGTATVEAAESYTVKMNETRVVSSVEVKQGDRVEKGQVLIKLEEGDSAELEKAQEELYNAENEYKKMLLSAGADYSLDELAIKNLEDDIEEDRKNLDNISSYQDKYEEAKKNLRAAQDKVDSLTKKQKEYENQIQYANSEKEIDMSLLDADYYKRLKAAMSTVEKYEKLKTDKESEVKKLEESLIAEVDDSKLTKMKLEIEKTNAKINDMYIQISRALAEGRTDDADELTQQKTEAEYSLIELQADYDDMLNKSSLGSSDKVRLERAKQSLSDVESDYSKYKKKLEEERAAIIKDITAKKLKNDDLIDDANYELKEAQEAEADAKSKASMTVEEAESKIKDKERELEIKKLTLAAAQKKDLETAGSSAIDIEVKQNSIAKLKERVEKLKANASGGEVTAQVAGVIDRINCIAGETVEGGAEVASIQMTEKGYSASISVSADQAKKVKPGDEADIQYFWYGDAKAVLASIKADKNNPQSKQLVFSVSGDVLPGQQLQLVMGGKGQQYESLVPNSSIREDNNGKFILSVTAKSSPLGNRYIAKRIDVTVLASDDTTSAVSGEIMRGDFIISTSTKPINPGDQVRLVNN